MVCSLCVEFLFLFLSNFCYAFFVMNVKRVWLLKRARVQMLIRMGYRYDLITLHFINYYLCGQVSLSPQLPCCRICYGKKRSLKCKLFNRMLLSGSPLVQRTRAMDSRVLSYLFLYHRHHPGIDAWMSYS